MGNDFTSLKEKKIFITGASMGLGRSLAIECARHGAHLVITARSKHLLEEVANECTAAGAASISIFTCDMNIDTEVDQLIQNTLNHYNHSLDCIILNHKLPQQTMLWSGAPQNVDYVKDQMMVNFHSYVKLATLFLPSLEQTMGRIVIISSQMGYATLSRHATYCASKHALTSFFQGLQFDLSRSKSNVTVTICTLGGMNTPGLQADIADKPNREQILKQVADPNDVAKIILDASISRKRELCYPYIQTKLLMWLQVIPYGREVLDYFAGYNLSEDVICNQINGSVPSACGEE